MKRGKFFAIAMLLGMSIASNAVNLTQTFTSSGTDSDLFWAGTGQYYHSASVTGAGSLDSWIFDQNNDIVNNLLASSGQCVSELINLTQNSYRLDSEAQGFGGGSSGKARVRDKALADPCGNGQGQ